MLSDCAAGWRWRSYLGTALANQSKCKVLASRHVCGVFPWNRSFSELEHQRFNLFKPFLFKTISKWARYWFVTVEKLTA